MTLTTSDLWLVSDPSDLFMDGPLYLSKEEAEKHAPRGKIVRTLADEIERVIREQTESAMYTT